MKAIDFIQLKFRGDGVTPTPTEVAALMQEFAKIKCQDLLWAVADNAKIRVEVQGISTYATLEKTTYERGGHGEGDCATTIKVDKDSILKVVDLDKFVK